MSTHRTRPKPYRRLDKRQGRPSVRRLALEYSASLDALVEAFNEYDGEVPYSERWNITLGKIKALSDRTNDLSNRLFRQCGYSVQTWTALKKRRE